MNTFRMIARPVSRLVLAGFISANLMLPAAHAETIGTETYLQSHAATQDRAALNALAEREDVAQRLSALGADPAQVQARVAALSDEEVAQLNAHMNELPAGGDVLGTVVFIFLVLLLTDILGFTDIFPFVKKTVR